MSDIDHQTGIQESSTTLYFHIMALSLCSFVKGVQTGWVLNFLLDSAMRKRLVAVCVFVILLMKGEREVPHPVEYTHYHAQAAEGEGHFISYGVVL